MKIFKLILPLLLVLISVDTALAQNKFYGKVIEVADGRTIVIEPQPKVLIRLELQYIEIPEAEQELHAVVKDHLTKIALGQTVEFEPKSMNGTRTVGQVFLKGVDLSLRMLRDGAAWYAVPEQKFQDRIESESYLGNERLARDEKRGVWSVPALRPAWEFRAEKAEKLRQEELKREQEEKERQEKIRAEQRAKAEAESEARRKARAQTAVSANQQNPTGQLGIEVWQESTVAGMEQKPGFPNLLTKYIPQYELEYTLTNGSLAAYKQKGSELKIESRSFYLKRDNGHPSIRDMFGIGFLTESEKGVFTDENNLTIYADKKTFALGKAHRFPSDKGGLIEELLIYQLTREQLRSIARATDVSVRIGSYRGTIGKDYRKYITELIESTE
jgi:endonuclease YncB( thermonuclease family)